MLAQMLQMQFDREFDDQLRREEKRFNGDNKGWSANYTHSVDVVILSVLLLSSIIQYLSLLLYLCCVFDVHLNFVILIVSS